MKRQKEQPTNLDVWLKDGHLISVDPPNSAAVVPSVSFGRTDSKRYLGLDVTDPGSPGTAISVALNCAQIEVLRDYLVYSLKRLKATSADKKQAGRWDAAELTRMARARFRVFCLGRESR